jgi:DNA repair protein RadC
LETGRRLTLAQADPRLVVRSPGGPATALMADLSWPEQETFVVALLDTRSRVIAKHTSCRGMLNVSHISMPVNQRSSSNPRISAGA